VLTNLDFIIETAIQYGITQSYLRLIYFIDISIYDRYESKDGNEEDQQAKNDREYSTRDCLILVFPLVVKRSTIFTKREKHEEVYHFSPKAFSFEAVGLFLQDFSLL
jgi:hypothetical protein